MKQRVAAVASLCLLMTARPGAAQSPAAVAITGRVEHPSSYTVADLAARPAVEVQGARERGAQSVYAGALLWPLLEAAGPIDVSGRGARLQHVLVARGSDGYEVVLAIGEVAPDFEAKRVIIATEQDGKPLAEPRLVVPGDQHAGRNVRALVGIDVR